jgi:hypothetical protein
MIGGHAEPIEIKQLFDLGSFGQNARVTGGSGGTAASTEIIQLFGFVRLALTTAFPAAAQGETQERPSKYSCNRRTFRRLARKATSKASPTHGTAPITPSIATLTSMRAKMRDGTPSRRAS